MDSKAVKESVHVVHGHHVFKVVWTPLIGEELPVFPLEPENIYDKQAVGIF